MSVKVVKSSVEFTEKFSKEVEKFFEWSIKNEYVIKDINDEEQVWCLKLLSRFVEPSRNKLENYIKELFAHYSISVNDECIEDAKLLAREFKESVKNVKKSKSKKSDNESVEGIVVKSKSKKSVESDKGSVEGSVVKSKLKKSVESVEEKPVSININMSLDTSETFNVETLEYWTRDLVEAFGQPKKTGGKECDHTWEWKLEVNNEMFTIYDWNENNSSLKDSTWYLGAMSDDKKNIKAMKKYIESLKDVEEEEYEEKNMGDFEFSEDEEYDE